jgi:hypothetical protein
MLAGRVSMQAWWVAGRTGKQQGGPHEAAHGVPLQGKGAREEQDGQEGREQQRGVDGLQQGQRGSAGLHACSAVSGADAGEKRTSHWRVPLPRRSHPEEKVLLPMPMTTPHTWRRTVSIQHHCVSMHAQAVCWQQGARTRSRAV